MTDDGPDAPPDASGDEQRVLDVVPDAVFVVDPAAGTVVDANAAAADLLDEPAGGVVGRSLRAAFPPTPAYDAVTATLADRAAEAADRTTVRRLGGAEDLALQRADGTTVPVELTVGTVRRDGDSRLVVVARDVSERRGREQRLSVFTRILRHNLRNDLNVVRVYAEELADVAPASADDLGATLLERTDRLLELAGKVRTVEAVAERDETAVREVDAAERVRSVVEDVAADHPGSVEVDASTGTTLVTLPAAFEVAVLNVVENALAHGDGDAPRAWVSVNALSDGVEVVVEDEGPGLPDHERAVLLRGEETQLEHGSGVGLWLVNWAANAAGGDVFFEATDRGSRVILWFPQRELAAAPGGGAGPDRSS